MLREDIGVYINDEQMLQDVRQMLEDKDEDIDNKTFELIDELSYNFLIYYPTMAKWSIGKLGLRNLSSVKELKEVLN